MAVPGNLHVSSTFIRDVLEGSKTADFSILAFRDPDAFVAGNIHNLLPSWNRIAAVAPFDRAQEVLKWIKYKVDVHDFFAPFKGDYKGQSYQADLPPHRTFSNSISCKPFVKFISDTITDRLAAGAISVWGKVNEVEPPHLVMPLTGEPTKPRLCNDNRFLNLWIKDTPFHLDSITALPRYVSPSSFQSVCDDKSGYDHILLSPSSRTHFGFQWAGWYFVSNTIPFGWKSSAYDYHSIGLLASHYFRSVSIPCSLYIDDRHTGELKLPAQAPAYALIASDRERSLAQASSASFIFCFTLVSLGYYINLAKSIIVSRQLVPYLGFLVDSCKQAFLLLDEKRQKFCNLVNSLIASDYTDVNTLQRLSGKCIAFSLAVPGARLFINWINLAIGRGIRSSRPIRISGPPKSEIQHWTFLESSNGFLPWRAEFHHQVILRSDASSFAWGGVFNPNVQHISIHDYWPFSQRHLDINAKEFLTLSNVLLSFSENISNCWVDVFTDSQVLSKACKTNGVNLTPLFPLLSDSSVLSPPLISIWPFITLGRMPIRLTPLPTLSPCRTLSYLRRLGPLFKEDLAAPLDILWT